MNKSPWSPACSFCGAELPAELVRAGRRDYWICAHCVAEPIVEDSMPPDVVCTFCEEPIRASAGRHVVAARRGAVLCSSCVQICATILAEDRALRARPR